MYTIRLYNEERDLEMLQTWCASYSEAAPCKETIPASTSYILEMEGKPSLFLSLILTNAPFCYLENFCGNPEFKGKRAEAVPELIAHMEQLAIKEGHKILITSAYRPKLIEQFQKYGFVKAVDGLTALCRRIA